MPTTKAIQVSWREKRVTLYRKGGKQDSQGNTVTSLTRQTNIKEKEQYKRVSNVFKKKNR